MQLDEYWCFFESSLPLIGSGWRRKEGLQVCWLTGGTGRLQVRLHLRNLQNLTQLGIVHDLVKGTMDQNGGVLSIIHVVSDAVCNIIL